MCQYVLMLQVRSHLPDARSAGRDVRQASRISPRVSLLSRS